ncbi:MAG: hypothetical protein ACLFV8_10175, partial [Alphaproteobacteria bacterium]
MLADVSGTFLELEKLLRRYGMDDHADLVANWLETYRRKGESAFKELDSLEWWGGAGSIADIILYDQDNSVPGSDFRTDN